MIDNLLRKVADTLEPGFKVPPPTDGTVHRRAEVQSLDRRVGKAPVRPFEYISIVHHLSDESYCRVSGSRGRLGRFLLLHTSPKKNRLPRIRVTAPLIEHQYAGELGQIRDL